MSIVKNKIIFLGRRKCSAGNEKCSDRIITDTFKDLVVKLLVVTLKSSVLECSSARELVNSYD